MSWFRRKPKEPVCDHRIHWQYVWVFNGSVKQTGRTVTEYSRVCRACGRTETGLWDGCWTRQFLESDVGRASDLSAEDDLD